MYLAGCDEAVTMLPPHDSCVLLTLKECGQGQNRSEEVFQEVAGSLAAFNLGFESCLRALGCLRREHLSALGQFFHHCGGRGVVLRVL